MTTPSFTTNYTTKATGTPNLNIPVLKAWCLIDLAAGAKRETRQKDEYN